MIQSISTKISRKAQRSIIALLVCINITILLLKGIHLYNLKQYQDHFENEITIVHRRHSVPSRALIIKESNHHQIPLKNKLNLIQRIKQISEPMVEYQRLEIIAIKKSQMLKQNKKQNCALVNSLNLLSPISISTIRVLLQSDMINQVLVLVSSRSEVSQLLLAYSENLQYIVENKAEKVDSDYKFINKYLTNCQKLVYLFGNHQVNLKELEIQVRNLDDYWVAYSSQVESKESIFNLKNLENSNLQVIQAAELARYIFVLQVGLLQLVTPLNFAYYSKYTVEEILLLPVLALAQKSMKIKSIRNLLHKTSLKLSSNYQFQIFPPKNENNSICFISYPTEPKQINQHQLIQYLENLLQMQRSKLNISLVIYLPYQHSFSSSIFNISNKTLAIIQNNNFARLRLRLTANRSISTLSAYESVYHYCPNQSLIVTSRHNIRFQKQFGNQIISKLSEKYHYIHTNYRFVNKSQVGFNELPKFGKQYETRKSSLFQTHFCHFQIYKSDFLKTNLFWILKSDEVDFYETEFPLVILMMEEIALEFQYINKTLVNVIDREFSEREKRQIHNVKQYSEYSKLINNQLMPYPYSCLQHPALRRFALDLNERNIHQIWLTDSEISQFRKKLHNTLKTTNPSFTFKLWQKKDIIPENLPLTYGLLQRSLQYHKNSDRSFYALTSDLMRYQILCKYGGLYIDFKVEGKKPLDKFLKYQAIYINADIKWTRFGKLLSFGNGIMGASLNNFHMKKLLNQLIYQQNIKFTLQIPHQTGSYKIRQAYTYKQAFTSLCLGYHLLLPLSNTYPVNACGVQGKQFDKGQEVFTLPEVQTGKIYKIGIPCKEYPQAFLINYSILARTWLISKSVQQKMGLLQFHQKQKQQ